MIVETLKGKRFYLEIIWQMSGKKMESSNRLELTGAGSRVLCPKSANCRLLKVSFDDDERHYFVTQQKRGTLKALFEISSTEFVKFQVPAFGDFSEFIDEWKFIDAPESMVRFNKEQLRIKF